MTYSLIVFSLFVIVSNADVAQAVENIPIAPDPALQAKIDMAVRAAVRAGATRVQRFAEVEKLRSAWEADPLVFSRQLLYYMANAPDVSEAMAADGIFIHFNADKNTAIDAVLPYIESDGPRLRETVHWVLGWVEGSFGGRPPDFDPYAPMLRANPANPPAALVRHMFGRDASLALRQFRNVYASPPVRTDATLDRQLWWADHIINDAIQKRRFLRGFNRAPGGHPLVREAMGFAAGKPEKPPKPGAPQSPSAPAKPPISKESTKGP